ncbi:MAG TPA: hypothetical protein VKW04_07215, partial [Planctomycetota bacterium]|nr:hypothetical protein [Planctomycetota bacterium]
GIWEGVLSFEDVVLSAKTDELARPTDVTDEDVVLAMKMMRKERLREDDRVSAAQPVTWM